MTIEKIEELQRIERQIKELEKLADSLKDEMKAEMGNEELVEVGGYKVHYTITISTRLDGKKLKAEMPSVYEKFLTEGISRRFSIT